MNSGINAPSHGKNVVNGLNTNGKRCLKEQMELIVKLLNNDASNIGMILCALKDVSIKCLDKCIPMESNVAQKFKIENNYSNINNIYTLIKGTLMLITEVSKCDKTTNYFHR